MKHLFPVLAGALSLALSFAGVARAADKELNLFCWSEYVPKEVIDGFTKETGVKVNQENYASNEEMLSKLIGGATKYDLIQPSEYTVEALIKKDKLEEIDWSKVPNVKNLDPAFTHMGHDPKQLYTVPWMSGSVGICVNTDKVKEPITGYKDVFQAKYKNRIVALNDNREIVSWALNCLGIDVNAVTPENLDKTKPLITEWVKLIKAYDSDSPKDKLIAGDCDLGIVWSGEAAICYQKDKKFAYVLPAEGAHRFIDSLCIPKGAPNKENAELFLNYILRPEVSKLISDAFPYTNPNAEARKLLTPDQLSNPASYPKDESKLAIFHDIGKSGADIDRLVTDIKSAGGQ